MRCEIEWAVGLYPPRNAWLGVTAENQKAADERIPYLLQTPAAVRFVSAEPLLGPLDLFRYLQPGLESWCERHPDSPDPNYPGGFSRKLPGVQWTIVGAESDPRRRGCNLEWVRDLVRQCQDAGTPVFVKQLDLDGRVSHDPAEWPADLRVREYPK